MLLSMKKLVLSILAIFTLIPLVEATHVIGGDINIQWVSQNNYHIKLRAYRDDVNGIPMPATITVGVYDIVTHALVATQILQKTNAFSIVPLGDHCYTPDPNIFRIEEGIFESPVNLFLANNPNGYYLSAQVNARNALATNVQTGGTMVWFATMPDPAIGQNSSPDFGNYPHDAYFCSNIPRTNQFPVIDADGDSLAYSLVEPLDSWTPTTGTSAGVGAYPFYPSLTWQPGYSLANINGGTPPMSINPLNGQIFASPSLLGFWTYAVRVEEFRDITVAQNGPKVKIGETRRDFQYVSTNCGGSFTSQNVSICQGDSLFVGGSYQYLPGIYYDTFSSSFVCDSILETILTIDTTGTFNFSQSVSICQGDSLFAGGSYQYLPGIYYDTLSIPLSCDSVIETILTIDTIYFSQTVSICNWDSLFVGGNYQNTAGNYYDTLQSPLGCDSVLETVLLIIDTIYFSQTVSICDGDSLFAEGSYQFTAGTFYDTLQTPVGCDSVVTTILTIDTLPNIIASNDTTVTVCNPVQLMAYGGSSYSWLPNSGLSCYNCSNPIASPYFSTTYILTGLLNGCSARDTVTITTEGSVDLIIPNVFTPNYDGLNDGFNLKGNCIEAVDKKIYNRWGQLIFQSNQVEEVWNGRTTTGINAPEGTYFYIFIVDMYDSGEVISKTFKGTVTLLR